MTKKKEQGDQANTPEGEQLVGAVLRARRSAKGLSIAEAANSTKIAPRNLRAIENHDYENLPTDTFARGLVNIYAKYLGLDPKEITPVFFAQRNSSDPVASARKKVDNRPLRPKKLAEPAHISSLSSALVVLVVILVSFTLFCIYASWNPFGFLTRERLDDSWRTSGEHAVEGKAGAGMEENTETILPREAAIIETAIPEPNPLPVEETDQETKAEPETENPAQAGAELPAKPQAQAAHVPGEDAAVPVDNAAAVGQTAVKAAPAAGGTVAERPAVVAQAPTATKSAQTSDAAPQAKPEEPVTAAKPVTQVKTFEAVKSAATKQAVKSATRYTLGMTFTKDSFIEGSTDDGAPWRRTVKAGEHFTWTAKQSMRFSFGHPDSARITLNGVAIPFPEGDLAIPED